MSSLIKVLFQIIANVLTALYQPFGFSLILSIFILFFYLYAYNPFNAGKGWKAAIFFWITAFKTSPFFRKLFLLSFVTTTILFRTLLNRNLWMNPLSDMMGGWWIWDTVNGEQQLTTECIENLLMMVPFTWILMWRIGEKIFGESRKLKRVTWKSTEIAFCFSLCIEFLQLFLRLGTFQLSDIFYNTLGGMIGGVCYWAMRKIR